MVNRVVFADGLLQDTANKCVSAAQVDRVEMSEGVGREGETV